MLYKSLSCELEAGVATLTLNRPERLNALTPAVHQALHRALDEAAADDTIRAVLLTGSGRGFCAGQDLGERDPQAGIDLGHSLETYYNPLVRAIRGLPKPVVCAVNGVAAGAGANLALCCDVVLAARSAKFIQSFVHLGLVPDCGGSWVLPKLIGEARAKAICLTGEPVSAEQAAQWGMIWRCCDDDALPEEAQTLARKLAAGPTKGMGMAKQVLQHSAQSTLDQQLDLERDRQHELGGSADFAEGVAAFIEKRQAVYQGR